MNVQPVILATEVISAALRVLPALICFDLSMKLAPNRGNYANAPPYFRAALWIVGVFVMTSMADLVNRALSTTPPHPLLTGYTTTFSEILIAVAGKVWLQKTWKPVAVREQINRRTEIWERLAPCTRREQIVKERRRNAISTAGVAIGPMQRAPDYRESGKPWADREFPPINEGLDTVIPETLRKR